MSKGLASLCIGCGHCVAVCPSGALDSKKNPLWEQAEVPERYALDPARSMFFLRSRRSIRRYKEEPVPGQRMIELLEIAWFAPSGHNSQGVSYLVVEGAQNLMRLREIVVEWMRETVKSSPPENPRRQEDYGNFDGGLSKIQVSPDTRTKPSGNCVV